MRFVALGILSLCSLSSCHSTREETSPIFVWEEEEDGLVAKCLQMHHVKFGCDPRGLLLPRTNAANQALVHVLGLLRIKYRVIAENLANAETTSTIDAAGVLQRLPYRRKMAVLQAGAGGEPVLSVVEDPCGVRAVHDPSHSCAVKDPAARDFGTVYFPNINPQVEMCDLIQTAESCDRVLKALQDWERP